MGYAVDQEKWQRVRQMMERHDLDAVVVRAPDNVLYLTNYWTMKGYDLAIFPREGDPTLLVIEPQFREAQRTAWNKDKFATVWSENRPFTGKVSTTPSAHLVAKLWMPLRFFPKSA